MHGVGLDLLDIARLERALDRTALRRLGVVAYGAAFEADLLVTSLAFLSNA